METRLFFLMMVNIIGQSCQNIFLPIWYSKIGSNCADPFIMYQVACLFFPVLFGCTSLVLMSFGFPYTNAKGNICLDNEVSLRKFFKYDAAEKKWICSVGFFDALNGALVVPASPADRTPPIISSLLSSIMILPMIVIKHFYGSYVHGVTVPTALYTQPNFYYCIVFTIAAVYLIVYPVASQDSQINTKVYWWLIFMFGNIFGIFYNVQQEFFFKKTKKQDNILDFCIYLTWETTWQLIWGYVFTPLNLIPNFGALTKDNITCNYHDTFYGSFTNAIGYALLFIMGYYTTFLASAFINKEDALIGTTTGIISSAIVIAVSYPIPLLTPDRSVVMIGLLPITFVLSSMASVTYTVWSRDVRQTWEMVSTETYESVKCPTSTFSRTLTTVLLEEEDLLE